MFLCRDTAFCRSSIVYANASHLPGEAIRIRKYIHLIHSRCNEIEYVLSFASLSFHLFSSFSPPAFSSSVFFSFLRFLSFTPFQPELSLAPPSNAPLFRLFPPVSRPPLRRQPGNQPASQFVELRFVEQTFLQLLLWRHSSRHHFQLYLAKLICKFLC